MNLLRAMLITALSASPLWGQTILYEAASGDSMQYFGYEVFPDERGDSVLVKMYRSFAPVGDTVTPRRQALVDWALVSARAKTGGYARAAIYYFWPTDPSDTTFSSGIAAQWIITFAKDGDGCWHIVNDTTPISTCVVRDDPRGPGAEASRTP
jgi:hypothetical protein